MNLYSYALRFLLAGGLVTLVLKIADRSSGFLAGLLLMFPVLGATGLLFVGLSEGTNALVEATYGAVVGLVAVAAFLLTTALAAGYGPGDLAMHSARFLRMGSHSGPHRGHQSGGLTPACLSHSQPTSTVRQAPEFTGNRRG